MLAKYNSIIQSLSEPEVSVKLKTIRTCTASSGSDSGGSGGGYVSEYKEWRNAIAKMHHQMLFVITQLCCICAHAIAKRYNLIPMTFISQCIFGTMMHIARCNEIQYGKQKVKMNRSENPSYH